MKAKKLINNFKEQKIDLKLIKKNGCGPLSYRTDTTIDWTTGESSSITHFDYSGGIGFNLKCYFCSEDNDEV